MPCTAPRPLQRGETRMDATIAEGRGHEDIGVIAAR